MPATVKQHQDAEGQVKQVVDDLLEEEFRTAGVPNAVYWIGVVIGAFAVNLLLLVVIANG